MATTGTQRIVTVLFADVVGSTAIGERLGPERSKFLFDEIVALIAGEVAALRRHRRAADGRRPVRAVRRSGRARGRRRARGARGARDPDRDRRLRRRAAQRLRHRPGRARRGQHRPGRAHRRATTGADRYNALGDTANVAARLQAAGGRRRNRGRARDRAPGAATASSSSRSARSSCAGVERPLRAARVTGARGPAQVRAARAAGRPRKRARGARRGVPGDRRRQRRDHLDHRRVGHRQVAARRRGAAALRRPHPLPRGPRRLVRRELPVLARARPPARLARHRRRRPRGARAAGAEGRARRTLGRRRRRPTRSSPRLLGLPLEPEARRGAARAEPRGACSSRRSRPSATVVRRLAEAAPAVRRLRRPAVGGLAHARAGRGPARPDRGGAARAGAHLPRRSRPAVLAPGRARARASSRTATARSSCGRCRPARAASWPRRWPSATLPGSLADLLAERAGRQPVLPRGGAAGPDRARRAAAPRRRAGSSPTARSPCRRSCRARCRPGSTGSPPRTREVVSVASAVGRGFGLPLLEQLLPREQVVPRAVRAACGST